MRGLGPATKSQARVPPHLVDVPFYNQDVEDAEGLVD
jgi:hypothetical protein